MINNFIIIAKRQVGSVVYPLDHKVDIPGSKPKIVSYFCKDYFELRSKNSNKMSIDYVNSRPRRRTSSMGDVSNSSLFDMSVSSAPNTSMSEGNSNLELEKTKSELLSAHSEIDKLSLEIKTLKIELEKSYKTIETYKNVTGGEANYMTPVSNRKRKKVKIKSQNAIDGIKKVKITEEKPMGIEIESNDTPNSRQQTTEQRDINKEGSNINDKDINEIDNTKPELSENTEIDCTATVTQKTEMSQADNPYPQSPDILRSELEGCKKNEFTDIDREEHINAGMERCETNRPTEKNCEENINAKSQSHKKIKENEKKKIVILADQRGRYVRDELQKLVGPNYAVTCFWKPGANLSSILEIDDNTFVNLTKDDFIIVLGGINDHNPYEVQATVNSFMQKCKNVNAFVSEIPFNKFLNEKTLNYTVKFICSKYVSAKFIDMNYSQQIPIKRRSMCLDICRYLLKDILCIENRAKFMRYKKMNNPILLKNFGTQTMNNFDRSIFSVTNNNDNDIKFDKSTQTCFDIPQDTSSETVKTQVDSESLDLDTGNDDFFRA